MKTLKSMILCLVLLYGAAVLVAQTPQWLWVNSAGGTGYDQGNSIAIDSQGNQYVTGHFQGTATFGSQTLIATGDNDVFVAKLDSYGNWLWVVKANGARNDTGYGIVLDGAGNAFVVGAISSTTTFGSIILTSNSFYDVFVAKLDQSGNWLWAVKAEGANDNDYGYGIALDGMGNIYVTGDFARTVSFGSHSLTSRGSRDIFVAKLDPSGNWLWAANAGGTDYDKGYSIAVDGVGNVYVTGGFKSSTTFFGSQTLTASGYWDAFVAKLSTNGTWLWAVKAGGVEWDEGRGIAVDGAGNAYVTGFFKETAMFGSHSLTASGGGDTFVSKLSTNGTWLWAVDAGGTSSDAGYGITLDGAGNIYVTGIYGGDIFAAKLDLSGNLLWNAQAGGTDWDEGRGIAVDGTGNTYITGFYYQAAIFGSQTLTANGEREFFIAKLGIPSNAGIPVAPQNLSITTDGTDVLLNWGDVTLDLDGNPVSVDHYLVYYCATVPEGPFTVFGEDGSITQSQWTHSGAALQSPGFYYVKAVVAD